MKTVVEDSENPGLALTEDLENKPPRVSLSKQDVELISQGYQTNHLILNALKTRLPKTHKEKWEIYEHYENWRLEINEMHDNWLARKHKEQLETYKKTIPLC